MIDLKNGDWVVCDQRIGQLSRVDGKFAELADGLFCLSGSIINDCRPLTVRNKRITESMEYQYQQLNNIDGSRGFNFPDINNYFWQLALNAIDDQENEKKYHDLSADFIKDARDYKAVIQGVNLFRRAA